MIQTITEYLDYRDFLHDFYKEKRAASSFFSYRFIAKKVGIDASHIAKIFSKKRHIPEHAVNAFVKLCNLNKLDKECFEVLVKFNKAKTDKEAKRWYESLLSLKDINSSRIELEQYDFYNKWYYTAILVLLDSCDFKGDYKWLANKLTPEIKVSEAKAAIKLLSDLGLIEEDKQGIYRPTNRFVTTGETVRAIAIKNYQQETIRIASESLYRHNKEERDISSVTISIPRDELPAISEIIRDFRQAILKCSKNVKESDSVYQLNVQLFPLTKGAEL